ncbi:MAG: 2-C-methyl-D-erythritol 4-phosphate cytidylyltransferase [Ancrocorticia sp.]|uniref:2-C-methyl-D-erythritol 4-phosphate cytidylyltransferase n=1 Tax=Ancrocorticia sp. TaxID=2593684 RepID=UPI003F8DFCD8
MSVVTVIAGAGGGTRLGLDGPKALVKLAGKPLIVHAVRSMVLSGVIDRCVVTAPEADVPAFQEALTHAGLGAAVVAGGITRQASVAAGLDAAGDADFVLIHDAARALTPPDQIRRVVEALKAGHVAVVPALPVVDTIKRVGASAADGTEPVLETLDRASLRGMQTPQGFDLHVVREAHARFAANAAEESSSAPDDAFLVEAAGHPVVLVEGSEMAMKVTRPLDLRIAELLASDPTVE